MAEDVKKWRKIDSSNRPHYLEENDSCLYYMDYQAHGGYSSSNSNNLINNFKREPKHKGHPAWAYKLEAANIFAKNLIALFADKEDLTIAFIPGSKITSDPEFDERFDLLKENLQKLKRSLRFEEPIMVKINREAAHQANARPKPTDIESTYQWIGFQEKPKKLILIDDVITTGAQFRAYKNLVHAHHSEIDVIGLFWGKTFWVN